MLISEGVKILGLKNVFTAKDAKIAYRQLARQHHPDKGGDVKEMKKLNEAYKLCSKGISFGPAPKIDLTGVNFKRVKRKPNYAGVIKRFGEDMLSKLNAYPEKKFMWRKRKANLLFGRLVQECVELRGAIDGKSKDGIIDECADVANFAMMIADNARRKL